VNIGNEIHSTERPCRYLYSLIVLENGTKVSQVCDVIWRGNISSLLEPKFFGWRAFQM